MSLRFSLFLPGLISVFLVMGCGGGLGSGETLVPVGGTLLVDGKPLDGVVVTFIPEVSTNSRGGSGTTDATGAFTVTDLDQNLPGLPAGKYTLVYSSMRLPDGSAAPTSQSGAPADPGIIAVETLPAHLTTPDPTNAVEIPEDGNTELDLKVSTTAPSAPLGPG